MYPRESLRYLCTVVVVALTLLLYFFSFRCVGVNDPKKCSLPSILWSMFFVIQINFKYSEYWNEIWKLNMGYEFVPSDKGNKLLSLLI